jgi:outer membrane receptor protein involved in Fe transport
MLSRGGSYDLSAIDPAMVERIEILRGAGSAIYGADAMGGVVNIITKRGAGTGLHGSGAIGVGGQDYEQLNATVSGGNEKVQAVASVGKLKDGRDEDGGSIDLGSLSASIRLRPTEAFDLKLFANHNDRESTSFPEASGGIGTAQLRRNRLWRQSVAGAFGADRAQAPADPL